MRGNLKIRITGFVFIAVVCLVACQSLAVEFAGGTGQANDPYQIATVEQLQAIGDETLYDKCFILTADIDLDPNLPGNEIIIDNSFIPTFRGTLNGNGHSISNMVIVINSGFDRSFGLIGSLSGIVKDIELRNITIRGVGQEAGALVGHNRGKVSRCSVTGNITGGFVGGLVGTNYFGDIMSCSAFCNVQSAPEWWAIGSSAGGLVGYNSSDGYISNCSATGTVTGEENVGGLVGWNEAFSYISNSYAMGTITGSEWVGGLVGINLLGYISNCSATGTVTGEENVGGLVGYNENGDISNCYATGTVAGEEYVGGLIGDLDKDATVFQCYAACEIIADPNESIGGLIGKSIGQTTDSFWDIQISGQKISSGGIGLSTAKLQDPETCLIAGWDMTDETSNGVADTWTITEPNTYPQLTRLTDQYSITQLAGSGTADDPYEIATARDLVAINDHDINAHYILVADIDMSGIVWATAPIFFFDGILDGRSHTISNLKIKGNNYLGLFGRILANGVVTNLTIQDVCVIGNECVGALAGMSRWGHITNCHVTGNVTGVSFIGGLVGLFDIPGNTTFEDYISDCTADVALSGNDHIHNIANVD